MSTLASPLPVDCMAGRDTHQRDIIEQLHQHMFADVPESELACLVAVAREETRADGEVLTEEDPQVLDFHVLLRGKVRVSRKEANGSELFRKTVDAPSFMGETSLLGMGASLMRVVALGEVSGLRVSEQAFWELMTSCPALRRAVLKEFSMRVRGQAAVQSQQEKLVTLGTMTAGLMHELNNPGAAARRAASQLRENLSRMHHLARNFDGHNLSDQQCNCVAALQDRILNSRGDVCMDSLQQSDREEAMGEWLDARGIQDAWKFAATFVASGFSEGDLACLGGAFPGGQLQQALEWLEATASSMQQAALVEESVSRVHELAKAVKNYVHEGQGGQQTVAVNESIHATLVLLKHKFREKQVHLQKEFGASLPPLTCVCSGLNQVWTNLLDNAIDAVPAQGHIGIRTWLEGDEVRIRIADDGPGIPADKQADVFENFYTTKPAGVGTGMGLGIAQRIVESYGGTITLNSKPGATEFTIQLPIHNQCSLEAGQGASQERTA